MRQDCGFSASFSTGMIVFPTFHRCSPVPVIEYVVGLDRV